MWDGSKKISFYLSSLPNASLNAPSNSILPSNQWCNYISKPPTFMYASLTLFFLAGGSGSYLSRQYRNFDTCMSLGKGEDIPKYTDAASKATTFPCASVIAAASAAGAAGVADVWGERAMMSG
jgi:hypothetical protein